MYMHFCDMEIFLCTLFFCSRRRLLTLTETAMLTLPQPRSLMGTSTGMKTSSEYIEVGFQEHIMLPRHISRTHTFFFFSGMGYEWKNHTIYVGTQGHYVSYGDVDGDGGLSLLCKMHFLYAIQCLTNLSHYYYLLFQVIMT